MRQHVGKDGRCRRVDHVGAEKHVGQGRHQKDDARQTVEKVQHGVKKAEPLRQRKAPAQQGIVQPENLNHAARPADALSDVRGEVVGGKPFI